MEIKRLDRKMTKNLLIEREIKKKKRNKIEKEKFGKFCYN
jgi:hypothetical protein